MNIVLGQRYELVRPVFAISERGGKQTLVHLQAGAVVQVDSYTDTQRLVKVARNDRSLLMFTQDLFTRGVCLA